MGHQPYIVHSKYHVFYMRHLIYQLDICKDSYFLTSTPLRVRPSSLGRTNFHEFWPALADQPHSTDPPDIAICSYPRHDFIVSTGIFARRDAGFQRTDEDDSPYFFVIFA